MARDDALSLLTSEFKLWGVKLSHRERDSGHIELRWQVTPDKEVRSYTIAKTPGDHRGWLNARAHIRRLFRHDGLTLKEPVAKRTPALHKALAMPAAVETDRDQLRMLRAEIADLTEMVLELVSRMDASAVQAAPAPVVAPVAAKQPYRSVNPLEFVSDGWNSIAAIARDMNVPANIAYRKLYYLLRKGALEKSGDRWRKAPSLRVAEAA